MEIVTIPQEFELYWQKLDCGFPRVAPIFADCMREAWTVLTNAGMDAYIENARYLGKMGRGAEPILIFLEEWPAVARSWGEDSLPEVMATVKRMAKSPNSKAIVPFLQSLPTAARRLHSQTQMSDYMVLVLDFMERTTGSVHGIHQTFPSPGLPEFFKQIPVLLHQLALVGLKNWIEYGVRYYRDHPDRQIDYFSLQSADSRAVLQRERHGTLLVDNERKLDMYLRGLWHDEGQLIPYSTAFDELRQPVPYYDKLGIRLPDVYDDFIPSVGCIPCAENGARSAPYEAAGEIVISGLDRYRAVLAHV